jgi:hypothetical protein
MKTFKLTVKVQVLLNCPLLHSGDLPEVTIKQLVRIKFSSLLCFVVFQL